MQVGQGSTNSGSEVSGGPTGAGFKEPVMKGAQAAGSGSQKMQVSEANIDPSRELLLTFV